MSNNLRTEWMFHVLVQKKRKVNDKIILDWFEKHVSEVTKNDVIKCKHCGGDVVLHQGDNKEWHAKHKNRKDAIACPGSPEGKKGSTLPKHE
jgi:competence CoiA-like predicted nuclease